MLTGIGLRSSHFDQVVAGESRVQWFEIISENFCDSGGRVRSVLDAVRSRFPLAMHGTALNIGGPDPVDRKYLSRLKDLKNHIQPLIVSDHLCWGALKGKYWHDLLPLPMTETVVRHTAQKVRQVQEILETRIALENVSTYLRFAEDELEEWEFLRAVAEEADCDLLLDVNNIYVNSFNHAFDAKKFIDEIPGGRVVQYHLAGHTQLDNVILDTHSALVVEPVWELYSYALQKIGEKPCIIEWDEHIPNLAEVEAEAFKARALAEKISVASPLTPKHRKLG